MNLRQVETFYWAARLGSFAKAARQLNATPSAVSMRIQELETQLGLILFDRTARSAQLAADGHRFLPVAEKIVVAMIEASGMRQKGQEPSGVVRMGVAEAVAVTWLPQLLSGLRARHPKVHVEIQVSLSYLLESALAQGAIDMAIAPCEIPDRGFVRKSVGALKFRWMCSPDMPEVPDRLDADDLAGFPLILTSHDFQLRGATLDWLLQNDVNLGRPLICNTFSVAARLCSAGLGLAFLPVDAYGAELSAGTLRVVPCSPEPGSLEHFIVRPTGRDHVTLSAVERLALQTTTFEMATP